MRRLFKPPVFAAHTHHDCLPSIYGYISNAESVFIILPSEVNTNNQSSKTLIPTICTSVAQLSPVPTLPFRCLFETSGIKLSVVARFNAIQ